MYKLTVIIYVQKPCYWIFLRIKMTHKEVSHGPFLRTEELHLRLKIIFYSVLRFDKMTGM